MSEPGLARAVRVVSLVPSLTESVLSWGVTPVACTRFCEQPLLRQVGGTKDPDLDAIVQLAPDLVLWCEEENRLEDYEALVARGLRCHSVRIDAVDEVAPALEGVAAELGLDGAATELAPLPAALHPPVRRRVFVPIWRRPWMTVSGGTYAASVLRHLGFDPLFADRSVRYPEVSLAEVAAARPDLVLLPSEPYPFKARHGGEFAAIAPSMLVDGQDLFWWGTRTPQALVRLANALA